MNQELKRRTRVVRIFPNPASCLRLASALLKEYHEDWITGRRYLRMEPLEARRASENALRITPEVPRGRFPTGGVRGGGPTDGASSRP